MVEKVYQIDATDAETVLELNGKGLQSEGPMSWLGSLKYKYYRTDDPELQKFIESKGGKAVPETREYILAEGIPKSEFKELKEKLDEMGCKYDTKGGWLFTEKFITNDPRAQKLLEESGKVVIKPLKDYAMNAPLPTQKAEPKKQAIA